MILIPRLIENTVTQKTPPKALLLLGARQVGKTTLLNTVTKGQNVATFTGDSIASVESLTSHYRDGTLPSLLRLTDTLLIDEAQRIPSIGLILKILVDNNQKTKIYVTGSSSLDLSEGIKESAIGRIVTKNLWPISVMELAQKDNWLKVKENLPSYLMYGLYPEVLTQNSPREILTDYVDSVLFKDVFASGKIRAPQSFLHLVKILATSVGSEVNYDNLSRETGLSKARVIESIDILEKTFIIKQCNSYARNAVNEIKKGKKIYFCDVGVRNALLRDFRPMSLREDAGALWENFFFMERIKKHSYSRTFVDSFFWRERKLGNSVRAEVDLLEVKDTIPVSSFECKLKATKETKAMRAFKTIFPDVPFAIVTPENFHAFFQS